MPPLATSDVYPLRDIYLGAGGRDGGSPSSDVRAQRTEGDIYASAGTLANLTVRGKAKILESGALYSGQTSYNTGEGFWLEANGGQPRFSIGNPSAQHMTWDGATLDVAAALTATTGAIGGWAVGATDLSGGSASLNSGGYLSLGTGNNIARMDAQDATYRFWVGNATAATAPFSVSKTGAVAATSGAIAGWNLSTNSLARGSGSSTVGLDSGGSNPAIYAGSSTPSSAPFRVSTAGAVTCTNLTVTGGSVTASVINAGTLNFGSSGTVNTTGNVTGTLGGINLANLTVAGTITLGSGGKIVDADGSTWDQTGIKLIGSAIGGDNLGWYTAGGILKGYINVNPTTSLMSIGAMTGVNMTLFARGADPSISLDGTGVTIAVNGFTPLSAQFQGTNNRVIFGGWLYPGVGTSTQTNNYLYSADANTLRVKLADAGGANHFEMVNSSNSVIFGVASSGQWIYGAGTDATALGAYVGRIPIFYGGVVRYIGVNA